MVFAVGYVVIGAALGVYRDIRKLRERIAFGQMFILNEKELLSYMLLWAVAWPVYLPLLIWGKR